MGKSRTQNSIRNISYGLIITVINAIISFITRKVFIQTLGLGLLSINGLFTEVITIMSLAELGVGMAIVYSLYRPLYEKDEKKISQLMSLFRSAYHAIAIATVIIALIILPFIDKLIKGIVFPLPFIRLVFFLFALNTACSYLFSYKTALLNADQKQYIVSLVGAFVRLVMTLIIIAVLYLFRNFILYQILIILQALITNLLLARYADRQYPFLNNKDRLPADERKKVFIDIKNIFIKRISGVITSSTDNILISTLVGTIQVGLYNNYTMLFSIVRTLKRQVTNGLAASIGNLTVSESSEQSAIVLKRLTFLYFGLACIISSGLLSVSSEVVTVWLGKDYVMTATVVYIAVMNIFIEICCEPLWQYLEVSGLFQLDKYIGILGSVVNLIVSIILGKSWGIVGIFIGTVCTQVIQLILKTLLLYRKKLDLAPGSFFLMWGKLCLGFLGITFFQRFVVDRFSIGNLYLSILAKGCSSVAFSVAVALLLFAGTSELKFSWELARSIIAKKSNRMEIQDG